MSCFPVHWQGLVMARKNSLNRDVVALGLVSLLNDISSEMIYPLLPLFLTVTLGAGVQVLGLIEGIAETTAALLKWGSGWISDRRKSRKPFALFGYAVSACTRPLMALAASAAQVGVIRLSDRVGKGIRTFLAMLFCCCCASAPARPGFRVSSRHGSCRRNHRSTDRHGDSGCLSRTISPGVLVGGFAGVHRRAHFVNSCARTP
jgi:MFS family permease